MTEFPCEFGRLALVSLIDETATVLEIGPFVNPLLTGPNVKYFDVLGRHGLEVRAGRLGRNTSRAVDIDFVSPTGDMSIIDESFDICLSSHNIEHHADLIHHLRQVERILKPGGLFLAIIPDKRYCFDHFLPESSIADILDAQGRTKHSLASVIEHRALITHNDTGRHWRGDHGARAMSSKPTRISEALAEYSAADGSYIDVHAWQFTPESFRANIDILHGLGLFGLRVGRVYSTAHGSNEFCAILQR